MFKNRWVLLILVLPNVICRVFHLGIYLCHHSPVLYSFPSSISKPVEREWTCTAAKSFYIADFVDMQTFLSLSFVYPNIPEDGSRRYETAIF